MKLREITYLDKDVQVYDLVHVLKYDRDTLENECIVDSSEVEVERIGIVYHIGDYVEVNGTRYAADDSAILIRAIDTITTIPIIIPAIVEDADGVKLLMTQINNNGSISCYNLDDKTNGYRDIEALEYIKDDTIFVMNGWVTTSVTPKTVTRLRVVSAVDGDIDKPIQGKADVKPEFPKLIVSTQTGYIYAAIGRNNDKSRIVNIVCIRGDNAVGTQTMISERYVEEYIGDDYKLEVSNMGTIVCKVAEDAYVVVVEVGKGSACDLGSTYLKGMFKNLKDY